MPPRSLNALDEQIAALKRKLREAAGSDADDRRGATLPAADAGAHADAHPGKRFRSDASGSSSDGDAHSPSSSSELAPIQPLPATMLPEYYTKQAAKQRGEPPAEPPPLKRKPVEAADDEGAGAKRKKTKKPRADDGAAEAAGGAEPPAADDGSRPRCAVCRLAFTSDAQLAEHLQGKKHKQRERLERLGPQAAGAPAPWRPKANPELQGPACRLCRKQFTSATQLEEHNRGKWHQMRLRGELPGKGPAT